MNTRKFFLTTVTVRVLSEDTPLTEDMDLSEVAAAIEQGDCVGETWFDSAEITPKEVAKRLAEMNSDPGFFSLTKEGENAS